MTDAESARSKMRAVAAMALMQVSDGMSAQLYRPWRARMKR
ncbi:hypothetical protein [Cupriavidus sp. MP-37]|nr:hypothetical protein [Cupriavidus sp. MP-37]